MKVCHPLSTATYIPSGNSFGLGVGIPPLHDDSDVTAAWPLDQVLELLRENGFSRNWQEVCKSLRLEGRMFLELGFGPHGLPNFGEWCNAIYPTLKEKSGTGWDEKREREEGRRLRKLISQLNASLDHIHNSTQSLGTVEKNPNPSAEESQTYVKLRCQNQLATDLASKYMPSQEDIHRQTSLSPQELDSHPILSKPYPPKADRLCHPFAEPYHSHWDRRFSGNLSSVPQLDTASIQRKWIFVTLDLVNYRLIDITGIESANTLRTVIFSTLRIPDWHIPQIFLTQPGQSKHEEPMDNAELWATCQERNADPEASPMLYVCRAQFGLPVSERDMFHPMGQQIHSVHGNNVTKALHRKRSPLGPLASPFHTPKLDCRDRQRRHDSSWADQGSLDWYAPKRNSFYKPLMRSIDLVNILSDKVIPEHQPMAEAVVTQKNTNVTANNSQQSQFSFGESSADGSLQMRPSHSYGPKHDFQERNILFQRFSGPQAKSDEEPDGSLFAIPLSRKAGCAERQGASPLSLNPHSKTKKPTRQDHSPRLLQSRDQFTRQSFADNNTWASRPSAEGVIGNLDEFFPGIDLDIPCLNGNMESPHRLPPQVSVPTAGEGERFTGTENFLLHTMPHNAGLVNSPHSDESSCNSTDSSAAPARWNMSSTGFTRMLSIREIAKGAVEKNPNGLQNQGSGDTVRQGTQLQRQSTCGVIRGRLIGKGTYGTVYLGISADTGRVVAVKQVDVQQRVKRKRINQIKEMVAAMEREIDMLQHLQHPHIVQYLGCERSEFSISIYLEYIPGGSIGACIRKHGRFEEGIVRSVTRQSLHGLAYLHEQKIMHRDLKADNILLDMDGTCKISDFGISKRSNNIYENDAVNSLQGSVFWMAPEVIRPGGRGYSAKVDIWSLGCVVLEMFAGSRPWGKEEAVGALFKLGSYKQAPPIPEDVSNAISTDALALMHDCFTMYVFWLFPPDQPGKLISK